MSENVRFTVAVPADIHRDLRLMAAAKNTSLNDLVTEALQAFLQKKGSEVEQFVSSWLRGREGKGLWDLSDDAAETKATTKRKKK